MTIRPFRGIVPTLGARAYVDPAACVIGDVHLGEDSSIWPGCVVRGDTRHYAQVADGASEGLMRVALDTGVPVLNGVLAVERFEDAAARAGGTHGNKGEEAALVAIEMANLRGKLA